MCVCICVRAHVTDPDTHTHTDNFTSEATVQNKLRIYFITISITISLRTIANTH